MSKRCNLSCKIAFTGQTRSQVLVSICPSWRHFMMVTSLRRGKKLMDNGFFPFLRRSACLKFIWLKVLLLINYEQVIASMLLIHMCIPWIYVMSRVLLSGCPPARCVYCGSFWDFSSSAFPARSLGVTIFAQIFSHVTFFF